MLNHRPFYHQTIRTYIAAFGKLFNNIQIERLNRNTNNVEQTIHIPLSYGSKEFWYSRLKQMPNAGSETQDKQVSIILPRMGYDLKNYVYDSSRAISPVTKLVNLNVDDNTILSATFTPSPWNFNFQLMVMTRNMDDMFNIVENILPFFRPELNITIFPLKDFSIYKDIPVVLNSIDPDEIFDYGANKTRRFVTNFNFTLKGHLYSPIGNVKIIRRGDVQFDNLFRVAISPIPNEAFPNDTIEYSYETLPINISDNLPVNEDDEISIFDDSLFNDSQFN